MKSSFLDSASSFSWPSHSEWLHSPILKNSTPLLGDIKKKKLFHHHKLFLHKAPIADLDFSNINPLVELGNIYLGVVLEEGVLEEELALEVED